MVAKCDLLCIVVLSAISVADGRIIYVDADAPGPIHDGTSWSTAYADLQDGIADGRFGGVIQVAKGRYTPDGGSGDRFATFELNQGSELWGGFAGFGEPNPDAHDRFIYETILSGDLFGNDDHDGDGFGNVCDDDADSDGVPDVYDVCVLTPLVADVDVNGTLISDLDGDCDVDLRDYSIMQIELTGP